MRWGRDSGGGGDGVVVVGPCAGGWCRWPPAGCRPFSTGRRSGWASRPAPANSLLQCTLLKNRPE